MPNYIRAIPLSITFSVISVFNEPTDGLVFEEVTNRGYHIQFEKTGLTFEQSVLALQKLACFHAASAVLMENVMRYSIVMRLCNCLLLIKFHLDYMALRT